MGHVPEMWKIKNLRHYALLNPESWSSVNVPESVEYVDLANTKSGFIISTSHYSWKNAPSRARRILRSGDVIVGTVRPGNKSYALIGEAGLTGSTGFAVLRPLHSEYREFVYLASTAPDNIRRLAHRADGAAYPAISPDVVADTLVTAPVSDEDVDVFHQFSNITSPIMNKILSTNAENRTLSVHRDLLLPKLMSGDIRMPKFAERPA